MKPDSRATPTRPAPATAAARRGTGVAGSRETEWPEPTTGTGVSTPLWVVGLLGVMLFWATMYLDENGGGFHPLVFNQGELLADLEARVPRSETDALLAQGRKVYTLYCAACHQPDGRGTANQFPPLAGSDWVLTEGPNRIIRIVLDGLQGPITVNGAEYNNVMLPWRGQLTDEEIAAGVTFVRANAEWGNHAGPATPAQVKAVRAATASRSTYWTAQELLGTPVKD